MDTVIGYSRAILTLVLPLVIAAFPLLAFTGLSRIRLVWESTPLLGLATLGSVLSGCLSSGLAVLLCARGLSYGMHGDGPKCVTGAVIFFPIGGFFTLLTLLIGLYKTGQKRSVRLS